MYFGPGWVTLRLAVVTVVIVLVAGGTALFAFYNVKSTTTRNSNLSKSYGSSQTVTPSTSSPVYLLTFDQTPICTSRTSGGFGDYYDPWGVRLTSLDNDETLTKVQPPGAPQPPAAGGYTISGGRGNIQYSVINFTVPNGNYNYTFSPFGFEDNESSGTGEVTVNGQDVIVYVQYHPSSCGALVNWNVSCTIQRVSIFNAVVVTSTDDSRYAYSTITEQMYNVTTFTTSTDLTQPAGSESTVTYYEATTGTVSAQTVESCFWLFP